jgi:ketosteroid isomerase-like protein
MHKMNEKPDFNKALQELLDAISNRNMDTYKKHITKDDELYTIIQNGHVFKTSQELVAMHEEWFKDQNWMWEGSVIYKVVGEDMAFALIKYEYRAKKEDTPFHTWLTYVFRLEDGEWRIIHDQNTALDFQAFAKSAGLDS